jgi:hypothetical protein
MASSLRYFVGITFSSTEDAYCWRLVPQTAASSLSVLSSANDVTPFLLDKEQVVDPIAFGLSQADLLIHLALQQNYMASGDPEDEKPVLVTYLEIFHQIDTFLEPIVQEAAKDTERWAEVYAHVREAQAEEEARVRAEWAALEHRY